MTVNCFTHWVSDVNLRSCYSLSDDQPPITLPNKHKRTIHCAILPNAINALFDLARNGK
jgi:hypothetical protein